jgi:hypothetical protein
MAWHISLTRHIIGGRQVRLFPDVLEGATIVCSSLKRARVLSALSERGLSLPEGREHSMHKYTAIRHEIRMFYQVFTHASQRIEPPPLSL